MQIYLQYITVSDHNLKISYLYSRQLVVLLVGLLVVLVVAAGAGAGAGAINLFNFFI